MTTVYVTVEVRRTSDGPVRSTSHSMRESWEDARKAIARDCEHYNSTGWFVSWRASENGGHSDAGESRPLTIAAFRELLKQYEMRAIRHETVEVYYDIVTEHDFLLSISRKKAKCGSYVEAALEQALKPEYVPPLG